MTLSSLPNRLRSLTRWKRNGAAFLLGLCAAAALPPLPFFPLMALALVCLFWLVDSAPTGKRAFADGWWFAFGHFIAGNYWVAISLLVDVQSFGMFLPFPIFGLSGYLAIYPALACLITSLTPVKGARRLLVFAAAWAGMEYLRGHVLTGFPWNPIASTWWISGEMLQSLSVLGVYGLGWLTVLLLTFPALRSAGMHRRIAYGFPLALLVLLWCGGAYRLSAHPTELTEGVKLRLVQAGIEQQYKWNPRTQFEGVSKHIALTRSPGYEDITHVIWPETALPYELNPGSKWTALLAAHAPLRGGIITGALRSEGEDEANWRIWNGVQMVTAQGNIAGGYDKYKLVPFGEFIPLRGILPLKKLTAGTVDFSQGPGPQTIRLPGLPPVAPLICYEAIFPELSAAPERASWLLNVTNDAWFGTSSGPYQHLQAARFRAIEQGLPLARAANTGISAMFDPLGRIVGQLPLNRVRILDVSLPKSLSPTPYARFSDWLMMTLILISITLGVLIKK